MDQSDQQGQEVRCQTDGCNTLLWVVLPDGVVEFRVSLGKGRERAIRTQCTWIQERCPVCRTRWLGIDPSHPVRAGASGGVLKPVA